MRAGQKMKFLPLSEREFRVVMVENGTPAGPLAMLGYARKLRPGVGRRTSDWMRELRAGEKDS